MNYTWFLFSFEGRISRTKIWLASFIWFAAIFSFMTVFVFVVAGIQRLLGGDIQMSTRTMHPAFNLLGLPLLAIFVWLFAATTVKRLHDRNKNGWWIIPFFIVPALLDKFADWLNNVPLALTVSAISFGLGVWCFIELFCLKGAKGPNRFGSDPLAPATPADTRPRWDQLGELEFVPLSAGTSAGRHVNRGHD